MSNAKHTPGPWAVGSHRSIQSSSGTICETYSHMGVDEADANERLIAAAPELLAALNAIVFQVCQGKVLERDACIIQARAAIAKAEAQS
jgi:hypothetical protein